MKKLSNESGMGVVEVILILVVVGIIGFTGWFVWQSQKSTSSTLSSVDKSDAASIEKNSQQSTDEPAGDTSYLEVKEWDVKIKLRHADQLEYLYDSSPRPAGGYLSVDTDSTVSLRIKKSVEPNDNCALLDLKWSRSSAKASIDTTISQVGNNYYYLWGDGGPRDCSASTDTILTDTTQDQRDNKFEGV